MTRTTAFHRAGLRALLALVVLIAVAAAPATPQTMSAQDVLSRSINYHDPEGLWSTSSFRIVLAGTRHIAGATMTTIVVDNADGRFHMERSRFGRVVETTVTGDDCWTRLDGSSELTEQQIQRFRLGCDEMKRARDYHVYLYGLPMKLRDAGTIIDPEATRAEFDGGDVWQLRVTYDPDVGTDTWYLYFDTESFALVGYRFYHDESANDGEYITLARETAGGGLRLPKVRSWYTNADGNLLGTDTVRSIERLSRDR